MFTGIGNTKGLEASTPLYIAVKVGNIMAHGTIMAYYHTPYVGMTMKKNGGHIKRAQMTRSKCLR